MTMTQAKVSTARSIYILFVLALITALNFYDRNLISILVEDLKRDLSLSDTQIGLLTGLAFAVVYSIASLPIARYADSGRRIRVLGASALFWSVMTGLCGFASGFWTLLAARFGVGVGEAGGAPTTHAIVAETFSPRWRGTALAVIGLAGGLGLMGALAIGGYVAHNYGWRTAFYVAAIPGILLSFLLIFTVRESGGAAAGTAAPSLRLTEALSILAKRPTFVWLCLGMSVVGLGAYGTLAWTPAYLMRHFHMDAGQVGATYGATVGPATLLGILAGGLVGDWLSRRGDRMPFYLLAVSFAISTPIAIAYLLSDNYAVVLALIGPMTFISTLYVSPLYAAIQALSGSKLRATGAATFMLIVNLIGQGFGPLATGWLSDAFAKSHGVDGLRYALIIGAATYLFGAIAFLFAARTAPKDIEAANRT
jgi:MFS family permease